MLFRNTECRNRVLISENPSSSSLLLSSMAVNSTEERQNAHHVVVLPDGGTTNLQYKSLHNVSQSEGPNMMKSEVCLTSEPSSQNISNLKMDTASNYATCISDVDIEKGKTEVPKYKEDSIGILNSDDPLARQTCLPIGGKFMQLVMNHCPELSKFASRDKLMAERVYDMSINRSRKFKRSHSFNSRKVVLMFSVLSSMGTIILIYLTLRVRQMADASINV